MSNELETGMRDSIKILSERGYSNRGIARLLKINRNTVNKKLRAGDSKYATVSHGNSCVDSSSECATVSHGASKCERHRDFILECLEKNLSARRIHQDLVSLCGFDGGYKSVVRFVRRFGKPEELPFRRIEVSPGFEMQVDFGAGAPVVSEGKRRRPHLFRAVLSCSRKGYSECLSAQTSENFVRALENSFRHFGGVPATVVIDNLKAGVIKADWFDPDMNPKITDFCRHYETVILPTRPGIPRHKGKIENGIGYVQDNALKGRTFGSLAEQNSFLLEWEKNIADTRIHGTTRKQISAAFEDEKPFLKTLPQTLFPCFSEGKRTVHRDGHVEVKGAYYSAPWEYVGREVWARWDGHTVRLFNLKGEQIAVHAEREPGGFGTDAEHIHTRKRSQIENGPDWLMRKIALIGPGALAWSKAMLENRGMIGLRVMMGLRSMARRHSPSEIDSACVQALGSGAFRLKELKRFIGADDKQGKLEFIDTHPLIRNLEFYGKIVRQNEREET
jgi:transposase